MITDREKYPLIAGAIKEDGLYDIGWYLGYTNGEISATLDGKFTARDLQEIAQYMLDHQLPTSTLVPHRTITKS